MDEVLKIIKGKSVIYKVRNFERDYIINGFRGPPKKETVAENLTVLSYFASKKQYKINYVDFQLLWVGNKNKEPAILLPPELCTIKPGQVATSENSFVTKNMIRETATPVDERKDKIVKNIQMANYRNNPYLEEFGFMVNENFELVNARILDPPKLLYNSYIIPKKGEWNIKENKFLQPCEVTKWVVINLDFDITVQKIKNLENAIIEEARNKGINMPQGDNFVNLSSSKKKELDIRNTLKNKKNHDLIIIILPVNKMQEKNNLYCMIKQEAELNMGCQTQCILGKTIEKQISQSVVSNILLKINAKLNGINHKLVERPAFLKGNVIILGADVTHPKGSSGKPSFAAVTASQDHDFFQYSSFCQLQPPTMELICNLELIVKIHLQTFHKKTNNNPDHIIFFRDGVSEGYFDKVKAVELEAIKRACLLLDNKYEPKITFVVVLKRHHTRFFPTDKKDSYDWKNGNIPAGTCVDTGITHPMSLNLKHFYLASHTAIQGVTKPAKYCTLHDDANLSYDDLEELSHSLCHMYSRCTRAVSYPAPTYYAHLAAERAKYLCEGRNIDIKKLEKTGRITVFTKMQSNPMFFI